MLVDLSIVDMLLRYEMLPLTLDVEHFSKVELLQEIEAHKEDGYEIVADFLATYDRQMPDGSISNATKTEINRGHSSPYASGILAKYPDYDFPAWAFVEVISFGTFSYFYKFCGKRFGDKDMTNKFYMLRSVRGLRNACAHNSCILNDMSSGKPLYRVGNDVTHALGRELTASSKTSAEAKWTTTDSSRLPPRSICTANVHRLASSLTARRA